MQSDNILEFQATQRVLLVVQVTQSAQDFRKEIEVLVSQQAGYLFVRTARPIYRCVLSLTL